MKRFVSFGYLALLLGGVLLAVGSTLEGVNHPGEPFSHQVTTGLFVLSAVVRLSAAVLVLLGLASLHVRQADEAGVFGLVSYLLVAVNMVLQIGTMWCDLFVTDMLSKQAPGLLDGTVDQGRLSVGFMLAWIANTTFVLLGIATLRAKVFRRAVGACLLAIGIVTLIPLPVDGPWFEVFIGAAFALAGWQAAATGARPAAAPAQLVGAPA